MRWSPWPLLLIAGIATSSAGTVGEAAPLVVLSRESLDSMGAVFLRFNRHWDELADLNTLERMLGTIRPTQREYLGCLQGRLAGDTVWVEGWSQAGEMKQLQLAVTGSCDSVPRLIGTWHTHPFRADPGNLPVKERRLSPADLETFAASRLQVALVIWDVDSLDAAIRLPGRLVHPAPVLIR